MGIAGIIGVASFSIGSGLVAGALSSGFQIPWGVGLVALAIAIAAWHVENY